MRTHLVMIWAAGLLLAGTAPLAAADGKEDAVAEELKKLEGPWVVESAEYDGKEVAKKDLIRTRIIFKSGRMIRFVRGKLVSSPIQVDPAKKPKTIDITMPGENGDVRRLGIYELDGDTLKIATGKERPSGFKSKPGSGIAVVVYKRDKVSPKR